MFEKTVRHASQSLGPEAFRPKRNLNAAVVDSVLTGIAERLRTKRSMDASTLKGADQLLMDDDSFKSAIERSTADEEQVRARLEAAIREFSWPAMAEKLPLTRDYVKRLDYLFGMGPGQIVEPELLAHWSRYMCVLVSGLLDVAIPELCTSYARNRSDPRVANFVHATLDNATNFKTERLLGTSASSVPSSGQN